VVIDIGSTSRFFEVINSDVTAVSYKSLIGRFDTWWS
jgi:hypothetical protein